MFEDVDYYFRPLLRMLILAAESQQLGDLVLDF